MASYGTGFAMGLNAGMNAGRQGMQMYDWNRNRQMEEDAGAAYAAQPQTINDYDYNVGDTTRYQLGDTVQDTPFTADQLQQYRMSSAADVYGKYGNVDKSMQLRRGLKQDEQVGLQLMAARRNEQQAQLADQTLALRRRLESGEDPAMVMQDAVQLYRAVPDGKHAGVTDIGGVPHIAIVDENSGVSQVHPITKESAAKAIDKLYQLHSPAAYQQGVQQGYKEQELGLRSREVGAKEADSRRQEEFYAPGGVYERTHMATTRAYSAMYNSKPYAQAGQLPDGTPVSYNQHTGLYTNGLTGKPLDGEQIKMYQRITGEKPQNPVALGGTGLIGIGSKVYTQDLKDPTKLVEVQVPGPSIIDRLKAVGQPGQSQNVAPAAGPQKGVQFPFRTSGDRMGVQPPNPLEQLFNQETSEIEMGRRPDYSPEVKQWLATGSAASQGSFMSGNDAYMRRQQGMMLQRPY